MVPADLVVSNFYNRSTIGFLAVANRKRNYRDGTSRLGLAAATRPVLGFGIALVDFDGDGWLDLIQTNGHVLDRARLGVPFAMRPTLLNNQDGRFIQVFDQAGPWFERPIIGRGLAVGDLDGDGRPDVVVNAIDASAALLWNRSDGGHLLSLDVLDRAGRPAVVLASGSLRLDASRPACWLRAAATLRRPSRGCGSGSDRRGRSNASRWIGRGAARNPGPNPRSRRVARCASSKGMDVRSPDGRGRHRLCSRQDP